MRSLAGPDVCGTCLGRSILDGPIMISKCSFGLRNPFLQCTKLVCFYKSLRRWTQGLSKVYKLGNILLSSQSAQLNSTDTIYPSLSGRDHKLVSRWDSTLLVRLYWLHSSRGRVCEPTPTHNILLTCPRQLYQPRGSIPCHLQPCHCE